LRRSKDSPLILRCGTDILPLEADNGVRLTNHPQSSGFQSMAARSGE